MYEYITAKYCSNIINKAPSETYFTIQLFRGKKLTSHLNGKSQLIKYKIKIIYKIVMSLNPLYYISI